MTLRNPLRRAVAALLRDRRPPAFEATDDEARQLNTAAALRAARPGADLPRPEFVEHLAQRLRDEDDGETAAMAPPAIGRRRFLRGAGLAAAAAVTGGVVVDRLVERGAGTGAPSGTPQQLVPDAGRWVDVGEAAALAGGPLRFSSGGVEGFAVADGQGVRAISAVCTHMGCLLRYDSNAARLACPCHRASFALDGTPTAYYPMTLRPLPRLEARLRNGRVEVFTA